MFPPDTNPGVFEIIFSLLYVSRSWHLLQLKCIDVARQVFIFVRAVYIFLDFPPNYTKDCISGQPSIVMLTDVLVLSVRHQ